MTTGVTSGTTDEARRRGLEASEELLKLNHEIREIEAHIKTAKSRSRRAALCYLLGPVLLLVLYVLPWLDLVPRKMIVAIFIPAVPLAIFCFLAAVKINRDPGGPRVPHSDGKIYRLTLSQLELSLSRKRDVRKLKVGEGTYDRTTRRLIYKEDAYADIESLRLESKRYRNVNNFLQGVLIIGALGATGSSAIAVELQSLRWVTFGIAIAVGIASGFMGYFKYKERSFSLQQTADAIEYEWEAFEVGIGRYKRTADKEDQALEDFVEEVHRLKSEQRKRQQSLEQPPDARNQAEG